MIVVKKANQAVLLYMLLCVSQGLTRIRGQMLNEIILCIYLGKLFFWITLFKNNKIMLKTELNHMIHIINIDK